MFVEPTGPAAEPVERPLPSGTVTFLFTDIEGSTRLVQELGDAYGAVLRAHDAIVDSAVRDHDGHVFGREGDAVFAAFRDASSAVAAAIDAQRRLSAERWPDERSLRVRMGIHSGEAIVSGRTYVGLPLHQVARIAAAGHGGQIVLSEAARGLAADRLPAGVGLRDLGEQRLKDLARTERLHQVLAPGLDAEFPALRTLSRTTNLPIQLTSFIGRAEIEEARRLLARTRLLTLVGPGGTGKTRLALQLAAELVDEFPDGIHFVPLDAVSEPELVPSAIAVALGIELGAEPPIERLAAQLRDRRTLLVLDNLEQVVAAAPLVSRLLREADHLTIIATSRIVLRAYGEQEFLVPPLSLPDPAATAGEVGASEAVRLFVERAMAAQPSFRLNDDNATAIADIVTRLDGLPLAIELAAARVRLLPLETLRARLDQRLTLLTGGPRDVPARQQTLRGAIDWSYDLLDEPERRLFERFSVLAGGGLLSEIEEVCGPPAEVGGDVLEGLASLVDKSLVRSVAPVGDEPRFAMLATIREYALDRLTARGETPAIRTRHAAAYLAVAEACAPSLTSRDAPARLDRLEMDHDNLRAAIEWALATDDAETASRLGAALWRFWQVRGHLHEARERLIRILAAPAAADLPAAVRARTLGAAGSVAYWRADHAETQAYYELALETARASGEPAVIAEATYNAGFEPEADATKGRQRYAAGRQRFEEALRLYREIGDERGIAASIWALAIAELSGGDAAAARAHFEESLALNRRLGEPFGEGWALHMLGLLDLLEHRTDDADGHFREAETIFRRSGDLGAAVLLLQDFALVARNRGRIIRYWTLAGASDALQRTTGAGLAGNIEDFVDLDVPRRSSADAAGQAAWDAGAGLSREAAMAYALGDSDDV